MRGWHASEGRTGFYLFLLAAAAVALAAPHLLLPLCSGWLESVCDCALRPSPSKRFGGKGRARVR